MPRPVLAVIVTDPLTARYLIGGQLAHLEKAGFDVHLITSPGSHLGIVQREQRIRCSAVPMHREIRPLGDLVSLARLVRLFRRDKPAGVSASTPKAGLLGMVAAWLARVPVRVYTVRGLRLETTTGVKRVILTLAERLAAYYAHHIVLVSDSLRAQFLARRLSSGTPTRVIGAGSSNGIDCNRYAPRTEPAARRNLAVSVGLDPDAPIVGFVGRLVRDKGIEDLVRAFSEAVLPRFPSAQLLILGDFEPGDPVAEETRRFLKESSRTTMAGFVEDTAPWYRLMDVLAFPSYREGFPNAPLEAAASGVPVVGYSATGTVDAVQDGETGILVPVGDRSSLGTAICAYLEAEALRAAHGAAGRKRALELFDQRAVWESWTRFYKEVLADPATGGPLE